jgi:hypothetical protein
MKTLLFSIFALQMSCLQTSDSENSHNNNKITEVSKQTCPLISSDTAVNIAQGYLFLDYDLRDRETKVETETELWKDKAEMWKVTFHRTKNRDAFGGDPVVWILKNNGEIFTVKHAK